MFPRPRGGGPFPPSLLLVGGLPVGGWAAAAGRRTSWLRGLCLLAWGLTVLWSRGLDQGLCQCLCGQGPGGSGGVWVDGQLLPGGAVCCLSRETGGPAMWIRSTRQQAQQVEARPGASMGLGRGWAEGEPGSACGQWRPSNAGLGTD